MTVKPLSFIEPPAFVQWPILVTSTTRLAAGAALSNALPDNRNTIDTTL